MKMKLGKEVFAVLFLLITYASLASAVVILDETGSDFIVEGCNLNGGGLEKDSCSGDGNFFCDSNSDLYNTLLDDNACTMDNSSFSTGDPQCCPAGYECNDLSGNYTCNQRVVTCESYTIPGDCVNVAGCFWIPEGAGYCSDSPTDFSCSVYTNQSDCEADVWNFGSEGFGTDVCAGVFRYNKPKDNTIYVTPRSTCRCEWSGSDCRLHYDVLPDVYGENGTKDSFSCQKNFTVGLCIDGKQEVNWTAFSYNWSGIFTGPHFPTFLINHMTLAEDTKCADSSYFPPSTRDCGEKTIRLPGISTLSLLIAIISLTLFYILREQKRK